MRLLQSVSVVIADNTDMPVAPDFVEYVRKGRSGEKGIVKYESKTYQTNTQNRAPVSTDLMESTLWLIVVTECLGSEHNRVDTSHANRHSAVLRAIVWNLRTYQLPLRYAVAVRCQR